jgi:hypothetical protein
VVANLLGAISERTCQIFLMQRGGYNYKEIASAFAIKPRTVEKHVKTAVLEVVERQIHSCERSPIDVANGCMRIADLCVPPGTRITRGFARSSR